ncbi:MAG: beta-propeller domain-containing protein [Firmicutes bacterium]|nr:beta-propeller domain-containing protein [Bacillota bacterium]
MRMCKAGKLIGWLLAAGVLAAALAAGLPDKPVQSAAKEPEPARFNSYAELVSYIDNSAKMAGRFGPVYGLQFTDGVLERDALPAPTSAGPAWPANTNSLKAMDSAVPESAAAMSNDGAITGRPGGAPAAPQALVPDYSGTNNQVQGVDEADLVKTDGRFLYVISGDKLFIVKAYPADQADKTATLSFTGQPAETFVNGDSLVVLGYGSDPNTMFINKYDITNRAKPVLVQEQVCDGWYVTARMIGENIYTVINTPVYGPNAKNGEPEVTLPRMSTNGKVRTVPVTEIYFFPNPDYAYQYTTVLTMSTGPKATMPASKTYLTGTSQNLYVSQDHIYLTGPKAPDFPVLTGKLLDGLIAAAPADMAAQLKKVRNSGQDYDQQLQQAETIIDDSLSGMGADQAAALEEKITPPIDNWYRDIVREQQKTVIFKLGLAGGEVKYLCRGEVDGQVLNQFSMDEYNGYFRLATTSEGSWLSGRSESKNNLFVLDESLKPTGRLLGLAPAERIYSARFMGDRAYLVTFRQVDPLFVIDLKTPAAPKVLGTLKITGFSSYLQPYDETHLIGIGREVSVATPTSPARQMGIKIALFDVANPAAPKEVGKYVLNRNDADSPALNDHRAVLFSRDKNLLVIPVSYMPQYRVMTEQLNRVLPVVPMDQGWQGALVFEISPAKGILLRGQVEHPAAKDNTGNGYYDYYGSNTVKRSLYIENNLYTISDRMVKANDLETLRQIKAIELR